MEQWRETHFHPDYSDQYCRIEKVINCRGKLKMTRFNTIFYTIRKYLESVYMIEIPTELLWTSRNKKFSIMHMYGICHSNLSHYWIPLVQVKVNFLALLHFGNGDCTVQHGRCVDRYGRTWPCTHNTNSDTVE